MLRLIDISLPPIGVQPADEIFLMSVLYAAKVLLQAPFSRYNDAPSTVSCPVNMLSWTRGKERYWHVAATLDAIFLEVRDAAEW